MPRPMPSKQLAEIESQEDLVVEAQSMLGRAQAAEAATLLAREVIARLVSFWSTRHTTRNVYQGPGAALRESHRQARQAVKALERNLEKQTEKLAAMKARYGHGR